LSIISNPAQVRGRGSGGSTGRRVPGRSTAAAGAWAAARIAGRRRIRRGAAPGRPAG